MKYEKHIKNSLKKHGIFVCIQVKIFFRGQARNYARNPVATAKNSFIHTSDLKLILKITK